MHILCLYGLDKELARFKATKRSEKLVSGLRWEHLLGGWGGGTSTIAYKKNEWP